jgi:uncharacterized protein
MSIPLNRRWMVLLLLLCLAWQALVLPAQASAHGDMRRGPLPADVRGTYSLASGEVLTLTGQYGMPSYEIGGRRVYLRPDGDDRFVPWDNADEAVEVVRDARGQVVGVSLVANGSVTGEGTKVTLYDERDVIFSNGDVELSGAVLLPAGAGPHPAVVLVHGAEAASRESYRLLASHFARRGVAALIYDKRGIGESTGSFSGASFDDLAGDALAGHDLLRGLPSIDPQRVGMLGISQGAWVIALAGTQREDVAFLMPVSASGFSPAIQDRWLNGNIIAHRRLSGAVNGASERAWRMMLSSRDLVDAGLLEPMPNVPGFWFHALDPNLDAMALWESVRQPVLGVWGELDCQVPARDSMAAFRRAFDTSGHASYTLVLLAGADHSINLVAPCAQETSGWSVLRFDFAAGYFELLADWVLSGDPGTPVRSVIEPSQVTPSNLAWHQAPSAGAGLLGSFLPQMAAMFTLLVVFSGLIAWSLIGAAVHLWRERRIRGTAMGAVAVLGLVAVLLAVASLAELLLLGSPDGSMLISGPLVLGVTPLFALATTAVTATIAVAAVAFLRAPARRRSPRMAISLAAVITLAMWSSYWALTPFGMAIM